MTKGLIVLSAMTALSVLLGTSIPASAHAAAPPADYLTRLLADYSDDWLGVTDGHNIIALDGYTQSNASLGGDVLVLRLVLDGGYAAANSAHPELAEHITFKVDGQDQELAVNTEDNAKFAVELGFAAVRGPYPQLTADGSPDGARFFVEGLVPFGNISAKPGSQLTDWFVQGEAGDGDGDAMPQYDAFASPTPLADPMTDTVHSDIGTWTLPATDRYFKASAKAPALPVPASGESLIDVTVSNALNETQSVMAMASGDGAWLSFTGVPTTNSSMGMVDVPAGKSAVIKLHLARAASGASTGAMPGMGMSASASTTPSSTHTVSGSGSTSQPATPAATSNASAAPSQAVVSIVLTSNLGGRQVLPLHVDVASPMPSTTSTSATITTKADSKKSPGLDAPAVLLAAALVAVLRRRA